jgi:LPS-assembly protein
VGTEVSRTFGTLRHALAPRLEWRAGSRTVGDALSFPAYDALDRAQGGLLSASPGSFQQLRAAIATRLEGARATVARAELGQDVDLADGRFAETFASGAFAVGPLAADARVRFFGIDGRGTPAPPVPIIRSPLDDLTEFGAGVSLSSRRGDALRLGYFSVGPGGSGGLVAGLDPLFDVRALAIQPGAYASVGARAVLGPATVGYDAHLRGRASDEPLCSGGTGLRRVEAFEVQQHTGSLVWESPCRCFRLAAALRVNDCGGRSWIASVDLARLASGALTR